MVCARVSLVGNHLDSDSIGLIKNGYSWHTNRNLAVVLERTSRTQSPEAKPSEQRHLRGLIQF